MILLPRRLYLLTCLSIGLLMPFAGHAADTVVWVPRPESMFDNRTSFTTAVLQEALARSGKAYRVEQHPVRMQQGRALLRLQAGDGIDVVSTMTSREREARVQPIRIPLDKGLLGWRLLLVSKQRTMPALRTLGDIQPLVAGQGSDWPDFDILRANGLKVYGTSNYPSLFSMLASGRIDYFPRGLTEIWDEQQFYRTRLAIEQGVVLRYPTALYFFVRKGNTVLERDIAAGLERMLADGSFNRMFEREYGAMIRKADLRSRRVIMLHNPVMPVLPLERKSLWFRE